MVPELGQITQGFTFGEAAPITPRLDIDTRLVKPLLRTTSGPSVHSPLAPIRRSSKPLLENVSLAPISRSGSAASLGSRSSRSSSLLGDGSLTPRTPGTPRRVIQKVVRRLSGQEPDTHVIRRGSASEDVQCPPSFVNVRTSADSPIVRPSPVQRRGSTLGEEAVSEQQILRAVTRTYVEPRTRADNATVEEPRRASWSRRRSRSGSLRRKPSGQEFGQTEIGIGEEREAKWFALYQLLITTKTRVEGELTLDEIEPLLSPHLGPMSVKITGGHIVEFEEFLAVMEKQNATVKLNALNWKHCEKFAESAFTAYAVKKAIKKMRQTSTASANQSEDSKGDTLEEIEAVGTVDAVDVQRKNSRRSSSVKPLDEYQFGAPDSLQYTSEKNKKPALRKNSAYDSAEGVSRTNSNKRVSIVNGEGGVPSPTSSNLESSMGPLYSDSDVDENGTVYRKRRSSSKGWKEVVPTEAGLCPKREKKWRALYILLQSRSKSKTHITRTELETAIFDKIGPCKISLNVDLNEDGPICYKEFLSVMTKLEPGFKHNALIWAEEETKKFAAMGQMVNGEFMGDLSDSDPEVQTPGGNGEPLEVESATEKSDSEDDMATEQERQFKGLYLLLQSMSKAKTHFTKDEIRPLMEHRLGPFVVPMTELKDRDIVDFDHFAACMQTLLPTARLHAATWAEEVTRLRAAQRSSNGVNGNDSDMESVDELEVPKVQPVDV